MLFSKGKVGALERVFNKFFDKLSVLPVIAKDGGACHFEVGKWVWEQLLKSEAAMEDLIFALNAAGEENVPREVLYSFRLVRREVNYFSLKNGVEKFKELPLSFQFQFVLLVLFARGRQADISFLMKMGMGSEDYLLLYLLVVSGVRYGEELTLFKRMFKEGESSFVEEEDRVAVWFERKHSLKGKEGEVSFVGIKVLEELVNCCYEDNRLVGLSDCRGDYIEEFPKVWEVVQGMSVSNVLMLINGEYLCSAEGSFKRQRCEVNKALLKACVARGKVKDVRVSKLSWDLRFKVAQLVYMVLLDFTATGAGELTQHFLVVFSAKFRERYEFCRMLLGFGIEELGKCSEEGEVNDEVYERVKEYLHEGELKGKEELCEVLEFKKEEGSEG